MPLFLTYPPITSVEVNSVAATACAVSPGTTLLTATPVAGTYLVVASGNVTATSAAGRTLTVDLQVAGVSVSGTLRAATPQSAAALSVFQSMSLSTNAIVSVNGSQAITMRGVASLGTMTMTDRVMDLVRLA